jgi:hypothetical protein
MELIKIYWGDVRTFQTAITDDIEKWQCNSKARSFRIRNTGNDDATILIDNIFEPLDIGDSITYGGYNESFRSDVITFGFAGVGASPKIIISQDIQQKDPIYIKAPGTIEDC